MKGPLLLVAGIAIAVVSVAGLSYLIGGGQTNEERWPERPAPTTTTMGGSNAKAVGDEFLRISLPDTNGNQQSLAQWRGKVLVLNYWATWCPPCREEMPGFSRLHEKYSANGVQFVGIGIDAVDKILAFQKSSPVSYPLLIGDMDTVQASTALGNSAQALPFTALFDRSGALHSIKLGRFSEAELEARLQGLMH